MVTGVGGAVLSRRCEDAVGIRTQKGGCTPAQPPNLVMMGKRHLLFLEKRTSPLR